MHNLNSSNSQESCTFVPQFGYNHRRPGVPSGQTWSSTTMTEDLATKTFSANKPEDCFVWEEKTNGHGVGDIDSYRTFQLTKFLVLMMFTSSYSFSVSFITLTFLQSPCITNNKCFTGHC